jgi:hypothetical protein
MNEPTLEEQYRQGVFSDTTLSTPLGFYDVVVCFKTLLPKHKEAEAAEYALLNIDNTKTLPNFIEKYNKFLASTTNIDEDFAIHGIKCTFGDVKSVKDFLRTLRVALYLTIMEKFITNIENEERKEY